FSMYTNFNSIPPNPTIPLIAQNPTSPLIPHHLHIIHPLSTHFYLPVCIHHSMTIIHVPVYMICIQRLNRLAIKFMPSIYRHTIRSLVLPDFHTQHHILLYSCNQTPLALSLPLNNQVMVPHRRRTVAISIHRHG